MSNTLINAGRIFDAVYRSSNPDRSKGFCGWQTRAQATRKALMAVKEAKADKLAELKEDYTPKLYNPMYEEMERDYAAVREAVVKKLMDDLDNTVREKETKYSEAALTAPTPDQLRLIESLTYRDDLTPSEISKIAASMADNLQALKALGGVVREKGFTFPRIKTDEDFETDLQRAVDFSKNMLTFLDSDRADLGYYALEFYEYADPTTNAPYYYEAIDDPVYSAVQLADIGKPTNTTTTATTSNTPTTATVTAEGEPLEMWTEATLTGGEYLHVIADQFHVDSAAIREANPQADLSHLYAGQKILVPSTRMTFQPGNGHVQPENCRAVPAQKTVNADLDKIGQDVDVSTQGVV